MAAAQIRKKVHQYVDVASEDVLKIVHLILEREYMVPDFELSKEDKKILDRRRKEYVSGKVKPISQAEMRKHVLAKIKK